MNNSNDKIIDKLYAIYKEKGFLDENTIIDAVIDLGLPLDDIDRVCDILLSKGVLVKSQATNDITDNKDEPYDKAKTDYDAVFNQIIKAEPSLKTFINGVKNIPPPRNKEIDNLMPQAKSGNQYAKNRIIEMYMRVAIRMAAEFSDRYDQPLEDAIQNALEGLIIAYEKYEIGEKDSFSIYIPWWIRQRLRRSFVPKSKMYTPAHKKETIINILDMKKSHFCDKCNFYSICPNLIDEISNKLELTHQEALEQYNFTLRLDEPMSNIYEFEEDDILYCDTDLFETSSYKILSESIRNILKTLTTREAKVIGWRFGFEDGKEKTLEEVGDIFGLTRERIRQIEKKALRKFQHPSRANKLKGF